MGAFANDPKIIISSWEMGMHPHNNAVQQGVYFYILSILRLHGGGASKKIDQQWTTISWAGLYGTIMKKE